MAPRIENHFFGRDELTFQPDGPRDDFENGARRIHGRNRTIFQRVIRIVQNRVPLFGRNAFAETVRIEIRPAQHRQDGAGIRIDGHDGRTCRFDSFGQHDVQLFFDRVFRNLLQPRIDGEMNGLSLNARHAFDIANGTPRRIDFDVARSVFPFQIAIVRIFQAGATHNGRRLIRISVRIHIIRPRFADVTQDV